MLKLIYLKCICEVVTLCLPWSENNGEGHRVALLPKASLDGFCPPEFPEAALVEDQRGSAFIQTMPTAPVMPEAGVLTANWQHKHKTWGRLRVSV